MLDEWELRFVQFASQSMGVESNAARDEAQVDTADQAARGDAAHDLEHIRRVVANARQLAASEGAELAVVLPAAWLHDCVVLPKNSDRRSQASRLAAETAGVFLRQAGYPDRFIPAIEHAIAAHSFSAGIQPRTLEAKVVQDADRLDALGAIGIARTLMLGAEMGLPLYNPSEPLPVSRPPDERSYTIDHFFTKLLKLASMMQTDAGRCEGERRTRFMRAYLDQLAREIDGDADR